MDYHERFYYIAKAHNDEEFAQKCKKDYISKHRKEATKLRYGLLNVFGSCQLCGCSDIEKLELHHILPLQYFGDNNLLNLTSLCKDCHVMIHKAYFPINPDSGDKSDEIDKWLNSGNINRNSFSDIVSGFLHGYRTYESNDKYKEVIREIMELYVS